MPQQRVWLAGDVWKQAEVSIGARVWAGIEQAIGVAAERLTLPHETPGKGQAVNMSTGVIGLVEIRHRAADAAEHHGTDTMSLDRSHRSPLARRPDECGRLDVGQRAAGSLAAGVGGGAGCPVAVLPVHGNRQPGRNEPMNQSDRFPVNHHRRRRSAHLQHCVVGQRYAHLFLDLLADRSQTCGRRRRLAGTPPLSTTCFSLAPPPSALPTPCLSQPGPGC